MKILCAGDLHIGRRPSKVPASDSAANSCAAAWNRLVSLAIQESAALVLLSGDIIDRNDRYFEAFGAFQNGLKELADAGIFTVAVAGNHDFDTLPRLVDMAKPQYFHLLGRQGKWEAFDFEPLGLPPVRIVGWSFPRQHFTSNPFSTFDVPGSEMQTVGLIHGDLNVKDSSYAPLTSSDLASGHIDAWVLGHNHSPAMVVLPNGRPCIYAGSLQAMDPGERGLHGAWMIDTTSSFMPRQVESAPIRYDTVNFDISNVITKEDFQPALTSAVDAYLNAIPKDLGIPRIVCLRMRAEGRSKNINNIERFRDDFLKQEQDFAFGNTRVIIRDISVRGVNPDYDLRALAAEPTPPGRIARLITAMKQPEIPSEFASLLPETIAKLRQVNQLGNYQLLRDCRPATPVDDGLARDYLISEGYRLLDLLMSQMENVQP